VQWVFSKIVHFFWEAKVPHAHAIATSVPTWKKRKNQVFFGELLKILFSFFVCKWVFGEYAESTI